MKLLVLFISLAIVGMASAQCGAKIKQSFDCVLGVFQKKVEKMPDPRKLKEAGKACFESSGCKLPDRPERGKKGYMFRKIGRMLKKLGIKLDDEKLKTVMGATKKCMKGMFKDKIKGLESCIKSKDQLSDFVFPFDFSKLEEEGKGNRALKMMMKKMMGGFGGPPFGRRGRGPPRGGPPPGGPPPDGPPPGGPPPGGPPPGGPPPFGHGPPPFGRRRRGPHGPGGHIMKCAMRLARDVGKDKICPTDQNKADARKCLEKVFDDNAPEEVKCKSPIQMAFMFQDKRKKMCSDVMKCKEGLGECKEVKAKLHGYLCDCAKEFMKGNFDKAFEEMNSCITQELGEDPLPEGTKGMLKGFIRKMGKGKMGMMCKAAKMDKKRKGKMPFCDDDDDEDDDDDDEDDDEDDEM